MLIEFIKTDFEFQDERGTITQLVHDNWKQVNYITTKAGVLRGNHYHKNNEEAFYIISGEFELELLDINTNEKESHTIKTGDFFIIRRNLSHSFNFTKDTNLISMYSNGVEEKDNMDIYTL